MYVVEGIAYAGDRAPVIKISGVRPLPEKQLWVRFNTGETKIFDCTSLLQSAAFAPLAEESVFKGVYLDYGVPVWCDGDIDIAPEKLYAEGVPVMGSAAI